MAGILVFGTVAAGQIAPAALEVAATGAQLAQAFGQPLLGALVGADLSAATAQFRCGFTTLYLIEGAHYRPYTAHAQIAAAQAVIAACSPSVVLFAQTPETREWVPRLAARLNTGLVMDCTALAAEGADLVVVKPVYGGGVLGEFVVHGMPRMATLRAGAFGRAPVAAGGAVVRLDVPPPLPGRVMLLEEVVAEAGSGLSLKDAKIVVAGGRGLGGPANWHFIEETAAALGAAVGCSRPVADSEWIPSSHQVGLSGTSVAPELYIAVGISGAVQHLAGISAAKTVVAVNVDAEADIFTRANYGVVGDYREVLPAFIERVRQLRS